jgi:hypothetical protein
MRTKLIQILITVASVFATLPLSADGAVDATDHKWAHLAIKGNLNFSGRQMDIPFTHVSSAATNNSDTAIAVAADFIRKVSGLPSWVPIDVPSTINPSPISLNSSEFSLPGTDAIGIEDELAAIVLDPELVVKIASAVMSLLQHLSPSWNVEARYYMFYAPVEADYKITVRVPGDWVIRPRSMVTLTSPGAIFGSYSESVIYDGENSSDSTKTLNIHVSAGVCAVKMSIGSFSNYFHSAGTMQAAKLDNPSPVNFTLHKLPVTCEKINLAPSLPYVGSSKEIKVIYKWANPQLIADYPGSTITVTDEYPATLRIESIPSNTHETIHIYGDPTPEQLEMLGVTTTTYMDVEEYATPTISDDVASFYFRRKADVQRTHTVNAIWHFALTEEWL